MQILENFAFDTATYERTNRTWDVVNTYLNVTFEDSFQTLPPSQRSSLDNFIFQIAFILTTCVSWFVSLNASS